MTDQMGLFDTGEVLKEKGMMKAVEHAVVVEPEWKDQAFEFLKSFPGYEFMTEEIRAWAYLHGMKKPPSERAWGWVMTKAKRDGLITHIGYKAVTNPKAHKTPASLWRRV